MERPTVSRSHARREATHSRAELETTIQRVNATPAARQQHLMRAWTMPNLTVATRQPHFSRPLSERRHKAREEQPGAGLRSASLTDFQGRPSNAATAAPSRPSTAAGSVTLTLQLVGLPTQSVPTRFLRGTTPEFTVEHQRDHVNVVVFKGQLQDGVVFSFELGRTVGPLGLKILKDGMVFERISGCCPYRYHAGQRLGGASGSFRVVGVAGGQACLSCRVQRLVQADLKGTAPLVAPLPARSPLQSPSPTADEDPFDQLEQRLRARRALPEPAVSQPHPPLQAPDSRTPHTHHAIVSRRAASAGSMPPPPPLLLRQATPARPQQRPSVQQQMQIKQPTPPVQTSPPPLPLSMDLEALTADATAQLQRLQQACSSVAATLATSDQEDAAEHQDMALSRWLSSQLPDHPPSGDDDDGDDLGRAMEKQEQEQEEEDYRERLDDESEDDNNDRHRDPRHQGDGDDGDGTRINDDGTDGDHDEDNDNEDDGGGDDDEDLPPPLAARGKASSQPSADGDDLPPPLAVRLSASQLRSKHDDEDDDRLPPPLAARSPPISTPFDISLAFRRRPSFEAEARSMGPPPGRLSREPSGLFSPRSSLRSNHSTDSQGSIRSILKRSGSTSSTGRPRSRVKFVSLPTKTGELPPSEAGTDPMAGVPPLSVADLFSTQSHGVFFGSGPSLPPTPRLFNFGSLFTGNEDEEGGDDGDDDDVVFENGDSRDQQHGGGSGNSKTQSAVASKQGNYDNDDDDDDDDDDDGKRRGSNNDGNDTDSSLDMDKFLQSSDDEKIDD